MTSPVEKDHSPELEERPCLKVAIIGVGAAGRQLAEVLEERDFPAELVVFFASERSAGQTIGFRGEQHEIKELTEVGLKGFDLAFFMAEADVAREWVPRFLADGCQVIDNSSAFRMDPAVPLVVPEVPQSWNSGSERTT